MKSALLVLAIFGFLLGGCYASNQLLLDPDAAVQPLRDGVYIRDGDAADRYQLTLKLDGWYDVEQFNANGSIGRTQRALLNAIDPIAGHPAYAVAIDTDDGFVYAAVLVDAKRVFLATPDCGDPLDRNLAVDQGAALSDDDAMTRNCTFKSRGALLTALAAFAGQADFGSPYLKH